MEKKYAIGIDLGTTYSCISVYQNNNVDVIPNELNERTTPSVVSFTQYDILSGRKAKNQITQNISNIIYDAKRLIGRRYEDKEVQDDMKKWSFKVIKGNNDRPKIKVIYKGEERHFFPEEISAWILLNLKKNGETYLNNIISDVVITVPARFNDTQRQATIDAAEIAGLKVKAIINEPTAAALAYKFANTIENDCKILIFDLGGGTFDISIVEIKGNEFKIINTGGDTHLGGEDFDNELMNYCIRSFKEETNLDITEQKAIRRLKIACENAKILLSLQKETIIELDNICGDEDLNIKITRTDFEFCISDYITKCESILESTLKESKLDKNEIDDIVLVGGSTRIPKIQEMIKTFFNKDELKKSINPDEAVSIGAAIYSYNFNDDNNPKGNLRIIDVCPYSLGIGSKGGEMSFMINKNTPLPHIFTDQFYTIKDDQSYFGIGVYQGEDKSIDNNYKLGSFFVRGIEKKKKGEVGIDLTFNLDKNGILNVSAKEIGGNKKSENLTIQVTGKNDININELKDNFDELVLGENQRADRVNAKQKLQNEVNNYKKEMKKFDGGKRQNAKKILDEFEEWIKQHPDEEVQVYNKQIQKFNNSILNIK